MKPFLVLNAKLWKSSLIIMVCVVFGLGVLYGEIKNLSPFQSSPVFAADEEPKAIYSVPTKQKMVALTFDISWGEKRPGPILDILEEKGVKKATFFLSSPWAQSHPEIVARIKEMGYEIGSHGHKHVNYSRLSDPSIREQIQTSDRILQELTGSKPTLIRMPNGDFDKRVLNIADSLGYTVIQWDTDSLDWMNPVPNICPCESTSSKRPLKYFKRGGTMREL